ncbi:ABC transporter permease [Chitinilyticum litopenaei]|uniref:ABC transporter permease n=1 Tax=Chitinilyticum litopenaei TaxID=1121276 RepID=UPI000428F5C0|nr:ABC transporter permease [Chitinilyticum litopenaei]
MLELALKSLANRKLTAALAILTVALSVLLLIGVERLRSEARASFANTVAGTDLIVGARTGSVQLLLYSVFRVGNASNNIGWDSYQALRQDPRIAWTIPVSLGDSHRGFAVLGTTGDYFRHLRYGDAQPLTFAAGKPFSGVHDAVLGAEVARRLGYQPGDRLVLTHGSGEGALSEHEDQPFTVSGILASTGTPVDDTVHVSLAGLEAIHAGWESGSASLLAQSGLLAEGVSADAQPESITAFYVGLKSRSQLFAVQRTISDYADEPLLAILPGVALSELWALLRVAEQALLVVGGLVVVVGLFGMLAALLTGLNERRREMAILRATGARPRHIFTLLMGETVALVSAGILLGMGLLYLLLFACRPVLRTVYGLHIGIAAPSATEWLLLALVLAAGALSGLIPAWRAYRSALADGLTLRV